MNWLESRWPPGWKVRCTPLSDQCVLSPLGAPLSTGAGEAKSSLGRAWARDLPVCLQGTFSLLDLINHNHRVHRSSAYDRVRSHKEKQSRKEMATALSVCGFFWSSCCPVWLVRIRMKVVTGTKFVLRNLL